MMKLKNMRILLILLFSVTAMAQNQNSNYDAALAQKYGADDYGMKQFVLVILTTPEVPVKMVPEVMKGHLENINRMVEKGDLLVAGPFMKNENNFRGLYIFDVKTIEEAKKLVETDPAVAAGIFDVIYAPWYGSAALESYLINADKIWKVNP